MPWPSAPEFTEAIQTPRLCFSNSELAEGEVELHLSGGFTGRPTVRSGSFACVYKVTTEGRQFAVRCFTREVKDQQERYNFLDEYLRSVRPEAFVGFEYIEKGMLVKGAWYPVVKMDWVTGSPLNKYVGRTLDDSDSLGRLTARWRGTNGTLRGLRIAHNDLQHGNVMVQDDGNIRLVDYDGIFLPRFQGDSSPEFGHRNFQHPLRTIQDYDAQIDNFPSLVIYLSLRALISEPDLWEEFNDDENLLLTKNDYFDPGNSQCFMRLKGSRDPVVADLATSLEEFCALPLEHVPDLESILQGGGQLAPFPLPPPAPASAQASDSEYRKLILTGQVDSPISPSANIPPTQIFCGRCGQSNSPDLIYCTRDQCFAVLHPGGKTCNGCREVAPANAAYCPECGIGFVTSGKG